MRADTSQQQIRVPWKYCAKHDFAFLYGERCPNCLAECE
jgi:hypothetical protein